MRYMHHSFHVMAGKIGARVERRTGERLTAKQFQRLVEAQYPDPLEFREIMLGREPWRVTRWVLVRKPYGLGYREVA